MKVKEISFQQYTYKRVKFVTKEFTQFYPENTEDFLVRQYGEEELHPEHGVEVVGDWLTITLDFVLEEDE